MLRNSILQTVAYADVFDYPLTITEIHRYLTGMRASRSDVEHELGAGSFLSANEGYYMLPGRESLSQVRQRREKTASTMWHPAMGYGNVIAYMPFVRMVAITGSLAMNNVDRDPDIDYFIVTSRGRLWTVRAMALALARAAAVQGIRLCPNYLVSEDALVFPQHTLYAAHELVQMVPIFGLEMYERICWLNGWKNRFLPNAQGLPPLTAQVRMLHRNETVGSFFENALRMPPAVWFERWEMDRKIRRLSREQSDSPESSFAADYCKGHNLQHGQKTEQVLRERLEKLHLDVVYEEVPA